MSRTLSLLRQLISVVNCGDCTSITTRLPFTVCSSCCILQCVWTFQPPLRVAAGESRLQVHFWSEMCRRGLQALATPQPGEKWGGWDLPWSSQWSYSSRSARSRGFSWLFGVAARPSLGGAVLFHQCVALRLRLCDPWMMNSCLWGITLHTGNYLRLMQTWTIQQQQQNCLWGLNSFTLTLPIQFPHPYLLSLLHPSVFSEPVS